MPIFLGSFFPRIKKTIECLSLSLVGHGETRNREGDNEENIKEQPCTEKASRPVRKK